MTDPTADAALLMDAALELARRGEGFVEPNPMVGAMIVSEQGEIVGEGWHQAFGGPHAEVHALTGAGERARGGTLYVTLEPCCHFGKTPPCTQAVIAAGISKVVVATGDPARHVAGGGIRELRKAGIDVEVGVREAEAKELIAPFVKMVTKHRPWVIAKWAMTLDGKLATHDGHSKWISNAEARAEVHQLRGRVDAIVTGIGTAEADNPMLTARPPGPRSALRVVLDSSARLAHQSQLVQTATQVPVLVATSSLATAANRNALERLGVEVLVMPVMQGRLKLDALLEELARRNLTNVLLEAGGKLMGAFFEDRKIDEVRAFIAPKLAGGSPYTPLGGSGRLRIPEQSDFRTWQVAILGDNIAIRGRLR